MKVEFHNLKECNSSHADALKTRLATVVDSGHYLLGKELLGFEQRFSQFVGTDHCLGVNSGLDALRLIVKSLDIGPGDEVLVSAHTFFATWIAVIEAGATLIPVDLQPNELNMTCAQLEPLRTAKTRAVIAVHMYGSPCDIANIEEWCRHHGLYLIEDAAQSHGASISGRMVGSFGNAAAWSFYPSKNLGSLGNGGAVTTGDSALADKVRSLRNYGSRERYVYEAIGMNSRLDEFQAAVLDCKLDYLERENNRRREIARYYFKRLAAVEGLQLPFCLEGTEIQAVWHQFPVLTSQRPELQARLAGKGIATLIHYPVPNHLQPALNSVPEIQGLKLPVCEMVARQELSLPISHEHTDGEIDFICDAIVDFFS